jgi:hypothetical protein
MAILNPITNAAVQALNPALRAEERLQSLLYLWLKRYFSGAAFTTLTPSGSTETLTFDHCDFDFQEGVLSSPGQRPLIHLVMPDRSSRLRNHQPGSRRFEDDWVIDAVVKVSANLSATAMNGVSAEEIARRVGGQLEWLLGSSEREAINAHGISRIRVERPSSLLPASAWQMRMVVFSCRTTREQARRSF